MERVSYLVVSTVAAVAALLPNSVPAKAIDLGLYPNHRCERGSLGVSRSRAVASEAAKLQIGPQSKLLLDGEDGWAGRNMTGQKVAQTTEDTDETYGFKRKGQKRKPGDTKKKEEIQKQKKVEKQKKETSK
jgi:hypothetical protein